MKVKCLFLCFALLISYNQNLAVVSPTEKQAPTESKPTDEENLSPDWTLAITSAFLGTVGIAAGFVVAFGVAFIPGLILLIASPVVALIFSISVWVRSRKRRRKGMKTPFWLKFLSFVGVAAIIFWIMVLIGLSNSCC